MCLDLTFDNFGLICGSIRTVEPCSEYLNPPQRRISFQRRSFPQKAPELYGWSRGDMLRRLCADATAKERARVGQQVYQLERRSELLLPISELFGIAPHVLVNHDLTV